MSLPPKWLFGLLIIWAIVVTLCAFTVGADVVTAKTADQLSSISTPNATVKTVPNIYKTVTGILGWGGEDMTFFTTGIGVVIRVFMLCLSAAIALPLAYDTIRLLLPWKS